MMFRGRKLLIVTKHGKERIIADLAESALGVECIVADEFDTDMLGTFTGEIGRPGDALETLRRKCHEGLALYGCDLAIASEGSFGPHPAIFIASGDDELVMLVDTLNGLEIVARELTVDTNFSAATINSREELDQFLQLARFPGHAVIVRRAENDTTAMIKGISDPEEIDRIRRDYLEKYGSFFIETDMRAMYNPTRMQVIRRATAKLIERAVSLCPACGTPGFGVTSAKAGLPCSACRCETDSTLSHISVCAKCSHNVEKLYPHGKNEEDPMYCNFCNP